MEETAENEVCVIDAQVELFEGACYVSHPGCVLAPEEVHHGRVEAVAVGGFKLAQEEEGV